MKTIQQFAAENSTKQPNADIVSRWESRVVPNGLHLRGRAGADAYLGRWGKGIKQDKLLGFAAVANAKDCREMAARFIEEAYFLETGQRDRLGADTLPPIPITIKAAPPIRESSGLMPQLPAVTSRENAYQLVEDPRWGVQEKYDGVRNPCRVAIGAGGAKVLECGNKLGLTRAVPLNVADALAHFPPVELDGELVGSTLHVFDILAADGQDLRPLGCEARYEILEATYALVAKAHPQVVETIPLSPFERGTVEERRAFVGRLEARRAEGFILKRLDAPYVPGDSTTLLKFQFRKQACVVAGEKNPGKRSIEIGVFRCDGSLRSLGSLTVKPSADIPAPGAVIEVKYLYVHPGSEGKLAQPEFLYTRNDVRPQDCTEDKLQTKAAA